MAPLGCLGGRGRKNVTLTLQLSCVQKSPLPPDTHPVPEHIPPTHTRVLVHAARQGSEGDGGSRGQPGVQEVEGGGTSPGLSVSGFRPPGKPTLGLQLVTRAA